MATLYLVVKQRQRQYCCVYAAAVLLAVGLVRDFHLCEARDTEFIVPPQSKEFPYPRLLHERDVIHYLDSQRQLVSIGSGAYAVVTLGELRSSRSLAVIKSFSDSPFREISQEVRIHRFVESLGITTRLIGLLPAGPMAGNISLVYEYLPFSKSIDDWLDEPDSFSTIQWLGICRQIAVNLQILHQNDILFNDLHRGNVLVQKLRDKIVVLFIDFGLATYKKGKVYSTSFGSLTGYKFLAPELSNRTTTTTASDVFAIGYTFLKIANYTKITQLFHLAHWCMANMIADRPQLPRVLAKLDSIIFEISLPHCPKFGYFGSRNEITGVNPQISETTSIPMCSQKINQLVSQHENSEEWYWLTKEAKLLSQRCHIEMSVLDEHDTVQVDDPNDIRWLSQAAHDSVRLAQLSLNLEWVVVKDFFQVDFDTIRNEICVTAMLAHLKVAPQIIGVFIEYKYMRDVAFVQEYYGHGVSLNDFLRFSSIYEWDMQGLESIAKGEYNEEDSNVANYNLMNVCEVTRSLVLWTLNGYNSIFRNKCMLKSYRQRTLEKISSLLIQKMKAVHQAGYLVNNFRSNNIIVKWTNASKTEEDVDVRLIDLGQATPISAGEKMHMSSSYLSQFHYLAPEVVLGERATPSSDIYSLCHFLYLLLQDYFFDTDFVASTQTYHRRPAKSFFKSSAAPSRNSTPVDTPTYVTGKCHADQHLAGESVLRYRNYQLLLLKCLKGSPLERPQLSHLLSTLNLLSKDSRWIYGI